MILDFWDQTSILGLIAVVIQFSIVGGVILRVMLTRHPPGAAFAWILITVALPYVGFFLYLMFGERPVGRLRARRYKEFFLLWQGSAQHRLTPLGPLPANLAGHRTLIHLATQIAVAPLQCGNSLKLLPSSTSVFDALLVDIRSAKRFIMMEFYIWMPGGATNAITDALIEATARGVQIQILVDAFGSREFLRSKTLTRFKAAGIEVASAMPMRFLDIFGLQRADLRLHRKTVIIDDLVAYTGSLNMIDPDNYDAAKTVGAWVDAMVRIEGPAVHSLKKIWQFDWALQPDGDLSDWKTEDDTHFIAAQKGNGAIVSVPSGPYTSQDPNLHLMLEAINAARHSLTITTPYFVPNEALAIALTNAALRGVHVRLILPEHSDSKMVRWASRRHFDDLFKVGIQVLYFRGGLLHTKSIAVDDEFAVFGTVNMDNRSLHLNFELMLLIFDQEFMRELNKLHTQYAADSERIDPTAFRQRPILDRMKEGACYLISPLL